MPSRDSASPTSRSLRLVMGRLRSLYRRVRSWLAGLTSRQLRLRPTTDLPRRVRRGIVFLVVEDGIEEFLALRCPCGCGETICLNLLPDERPRWSLCRHKGDSFSVHPSIWRTTGCRSHFFIRSGRIVWSRDAGGPSRF